MSRWLCLLLTVCLSGSAFGQNPNYRTFGGGGFWDVAATWEVEALPNGSDSWSMAVSAPTSATANMISILTGATVTVRVPVTIDQTTINSGGTITVNDPVILTLNNGTLADLTIEAGGILNMLGESALKPSGAPNLTVNGTIMVGSLNATGAILSGAAAAGNIRIASRTYTAGATIIYAGSGAQFMGNGQQNVAGVNAIINNAAGVTTAVNVTVGGDLTVNSGTMAVNSTISGLARTLNVKGNLNLAGGAFALTSGTAMATLNVTGTLGLANNLTITSGTVNANLNITGDISGAGKIQSSGANSNVTINGSGALTNSFPFGSGSQFELITINRAGENLVFPANHNLSILGFRLSAGTAQTLGYLKIAGNLNLAAGTSLDFSGQILELGGRFNNLVSGGTLKGNASSSLKLTGSGAFGTLALTAPSNKIRAIDLNRTGGATLTLNIPLTLDSLLMEDGIVSNTAGLALSLGGYVLRNSNASFSGAAPTGGPYDLEYTGVTMTTGTEAGGSVNNMTSDCTGILTLGADLAPAGTLTINSGTLTSSTRNITVPNLLNSGIMNAPTSGASTGLTVSATFVNNGTFNNNSGTVLIAGPVTPSGSNIANTNFFNLTIKPAAVLTGPANLVVQGNWTNNGSFVQGTGTVTFSGAVGLKTISGTTPTTFYDVILNKTNMVGQISLSVTSAQTITHSLTLSDGQLDITSGLLAMNPGPTTITKNSTGSISNTSPGGAPWNLIYIGGSQTTSLEIPASGNLLSVTLNTSNMSIVTLGAGQSLTVSGSFSNPSSGRTFTSGANDITVASLSNAGTFNAPTSGATTGLSISSGFTNDGTFNNNSGTVLFTGPVTPGGANIASTNFYNITIKPTGTLTSPSTLNVQGDFVNNGAFVQGTNTVVFNGAVGLKTISGTTSTTFYDLTLNKTNMAGQVSLSIASAQSVTHFLTLTNGQLDITASLLSLSPNSTISKDAAASITTSGPGGGLWNLIYTGGSQMTSLEIPISGNVLSLTVNTNNPSTVTLVALQTLNVSNAFAIPAVGRGFALAGSGNLVTAGSFTSAGTFTSGVNNVTFGAFSNSGTFNAPTNMATTGLTVSGSFVNDGTFNHLSGTVFFSGPIALTGININTTNFSNITINPGATLTPSATLNVQGNFTNNGSFVQGTGTVLLNGAVGAKSIGGTTSTTFYNLTLNKTNMAGNSLSLGAVTTISNILTLIDGTFDNTAGRLTMAPASGIVRNVAAAGTGFIVTTVPSGGPYDLTYTGDVNVTPALEIQGALRDFTNNNTAIVTLNAPLSLARTLTVNAGTVTSGANVIVATNVLLTAGVFTGPSTTLTLTGDFTNNAADNAFGANGGTVVFNGTSNILGTHTTTFNHVLISNTLNGPADLHLTGDFINNATFNQGSGKVSFTGSSLQNIAGSVTTTFNDLFVSNAMSPVSVSVEHSSNLQGVLTLSSGTQFDADGSADAAIFTVLSLNEAPTQDGSIAAIPSGAAVLGNATVQRFVGARDNDDRWLSSAVTNAPVSQLQDDFAVTGNFTGTSFPCTGCSSNSSNLHYYDEHVPGVLKSAGSYKPTPVNLGTNAEQLVVGRGYDAFIWNGVSPFNVDVTGPVNQGQITFPLVTYTNNSVVSADGWNLMGNPYPSAIEWDGPGWGRPSIDPTVWVWDWKVNNFHSYNYLTHTGDLPNGTIAMGSAFWVYTTTTVTMTIDEPAKSSAGGSYYRKAVSPFPGLQVSITKGQDSNSSFILFDDRATANFDAGMDAPKLEVGSIFIAPMDEQQRRLTTLAVNSSYNKDIPLYVYAENTGEYQISLSGINEYTPDGGLYLVDAFLRTSEPVSGMQPYRFSVTNNTRTWDKRFFLSRNPDALLAGAENQIQITCYPNPVSSSLSIEVNARVSNVSFINSLGKYVGDVSMIEDNGISRGLINVGDLPSGIYFVRTYVSDKVLITKIIKY